MQVINVAAKSKLAILGGTALMAAASVFAINPAYAEVEIAGNVGVVSGYVFRGITNTPENDGAAVQAGLDLTSTESGFYSGWWASNLSYGTPDLSTTVEHNFYGGYSGESGGLSYDIGALYYWYMDDSDGSVIEPYLGLSFGGIDFGMKYMAEDATWSNQGDMFFTLGTSFDLGEGFGLGITGSYATYEDSGDFIPATAESGAFRSLDITLSKAIAETPGEFFVTYIVGGDDRNGVGQEDKAVFGFSYSF
ncbi:MAG: TorF family putative porin [Gammaproteobacteria bacterium]|nr:TorF family putative porin [Gammaproteobacteria bacterium]